MCLTKMFFKYDDFCKDFEFQWNKFLLQSGANSGNRSGKLTLSERMTIFTLFHQSNYRTFKHFYKNYVERNLKQYFPNLISYERFVALMPSMLIPLTVFVYSQRGKCTGISYVDSTKLSVCANIRIPRNKVFKDTAKRGKSSIGWFYGFKLHLVVNDKGEILAFYISAGNMDDRTPVPQMVSSLFGKLFGDKGYISKKLFDSLRRDKKFVLEVIEQNTPAVKLYQKFGFKIIRRLHGFELNNPKLKETIDNKIEESNLSSLLIFLLQNSSINLPWQISMPNLIKFNTPDRVLKTDKAFAVISDPEKETIAIKTLIPKDGKIEFAEGLLRRLFTLYPEKIWKANVHYPEEFMPLFKQFGFQEHKLTQFQMEYII